MKSYIFSGRLFLESPFAVGSGLSSALCDRLILRDKKGKPYIPGTTLTGILRQTARQFLGCDDDHPDIVTVFGQSSALEEGQAARLIIRDAINLEESGCESEFREHVAIDREKGVSKEKSLFNEEVGQRQMAFSFYCRCDWEGEDDQSQALSLMCRIIQYLGEDGGSLGGRIGVGLGRFKLKDIELFEFQWSDIASLTEWLKSDGSRPVAGVKKNIEDFITPSHRCTSSALKLRIKGKLRPIEPVLVKIETSQEWCRRKYVDLNGLSLQEGNWNQDEIEVDSAFVRTWGDRGERNLAYLPGSSLRGSLRSHAEKIIRTLVYYEFQKINRAGQYNSHKGAPLDPGEGGEANLLENLFGTREKGGVFTVGEAYPENPVAFENRLKLEDFVAIDRFRGGAAEQQKFNARPFFPKGIDDSSGDLEFYLEVRAGAEDWEIGLIALVLKDLRDGLIRVGYGKRKGFGKVKLIPESILIDGKEYGSMEEGELVERFEAMVGELRTEILKYCQGMLSIPGEADTGQEEEFNQ